MIQDCSFANPPSISFPSSSSSSSSPSLLSCPFAFRCCLTQPVVFSSPFDSDAIPSSSSSSSSPPFLPRQKANAGVVPTPPGNSYPPKYSAGFVLTSTGSVPTPPGAIQTPPGILLSLSRRHLKHIQPYWNHTGVIWLLAAIVSSSATAMIGKTASYI